MRLKPFLKRVFLGTNAFRYPSVRYCAENSLLPSVLTRTSPKDLRRLLFLPESSHHTQLNQDVFALLANKFKPGFFIEIGANDGFTLSNTLTLEQHHNWEGLLIEANPMYMESLNRRRAKVEIAAVVNQEGYYEFRSAGLYGGISELLDTTHEDKTKDSQSIKVWGTTLSTILEKHNSPNIVNFISIDVEGAEVAIVEELCSLEKFRFLCGCIEFNNRRNDYIRIQSALSKAGYEVVWKAQTAHDLFFIDQRQIATRD